MRLRTPTIRFHAAALAVCTGWALQALGAGGITPLRPSGKPGALAPTVTPPRQTVPVSSPPVYKDPDFPDAKAAPLRGFFDRSRPKLVVLVHGATSDPDRTRDRVLNTLEWVRAYWGYRMVRAILGAGHPGRPLYTFSGQRLDSRTWPEGAHYITPALSRLPTVAVDENRWDDYFITTSRVVTRRGARQPPVSVLLTHRNGGKSLETQARQAVNQIFTLYNRCLNAYPEFEEPQIILVAHSMGGLVSRYILCNAFSLRDRAARFRADFIRNRTICLVTLATPHEGSPAADAVDRLVRELTQVPPFLQGIFDGLGIQNPMEYLLRQTPLGSAYDEATRDLMVSRMHWLNRGPLEPARAIRSDGTLIPIYAVGGRTPDRGVFNRPYVPQAPDLLRAVNNDFETAAHVAGLVAIDYLFKTRGENWGSPPDPSLDRVQRVSVRVLVETNVQEAVDQISGNPGFRAAAEAAGGATQLALRSLRNRFDIYAPMYLDRKWKGQLGSCPFPFPHWVCGNFVLPWKDCRSLTPGCISSVLYNLGYNVGQLFSCALPDSWRKEETIDVPCVQLVPFGSVPPSDGEVDSDGMVPLDSALGWTLGRGRENPRYFDHTRQWLAGGRRQWGSWYRYLDGPWNRDNHGSILSNAEVGGWIHHSIVSQAGPLPGPGELSTWPRIFQRGQQIVRPESRETAPLKQPPLPTRPKGR